MPQTTTVSPGTEASFQAQILQKSLDVISFYLEGRDRWNPARGLNALLGQAVSEYESRFLIELVQNAYDAQPSSATGRISIHLDEREGPAGVLYVANTGVPFERKDFVSISEFAQSSKELGESIGNKGIGFKSVLAVCRRPEIYSVAAPASGELDGFCFRFADLDDVTKIVGDARRATEVLEDVGPYFLPVPLSEAPQRAAAFARDGYVSVIRLPLEDDAALEAARREMGNLRDSAAPVHLFLDRLEELELTHVQDDGATTTTRLTRASTRVAGVKEAHIEEVDLGLQGRWIAGSRRVAPDALSAALRASVDLRLIDERWIDEWKAPAHVSVGVRVDDCEQISRYYTFLPMGEACETPFAGCVHAPFVTKLARTDLSDAVPLNSLFMDIAADCAVDLLIYLAEGPVRRAPPATSLDLFGWSTADLGRLEEAFGRAGLDPLRSDVVPAVRRDREQTWVSLNEVFSWDERDCLVMTARRIMEATEVALLSEGIAADRLERLDAVAQELGRTEGLDPPSEVVAAWAELVAADLAKRRFKAANWQGFYADLAAILESDPEALRDRRIIVDDDRKLHLCAAARTEDDDRRPLVFFPQARTDEVDDEDAPAVRVPARLKRRMISVNRDIQWVAREGSTRRATAAQHFFADNRLIRPFDRRSLIEHVGRVMRRSHSPRTFADALQFAFALHVTAPSGTLNLSRARLQVPTVNGWRPASEGLFSSAWVTEAGERLEMLLGRAKGVSAELVALADRLLAAPEDWPFAVDDRAAWRRFLRAAGVRAGLPALPVDLHGRSIEAWQIQPASLATRMGLDDPTAEAWQAAIDDEGDQRPDGTYKDYATRHGIWRLPGLADYRQLDSAGRLLFASVIVDSLKEWDDQHLRVEWYRPSYPSHATVSWPTPLSAALSETPWIPLRDPGAPESTPYSLPRDAWHVEAASREEAPTFAPLVAHRIRRLIDAGESALPRLRRLGLKVWDEPEYADELLLFLGRLVDEALLTEGGVVPFQKTYRETLAAVASDASDTNVNLWEAPLVVSRSGRLAVARANDDPAMPIYVAERRTLHRRIIELLPVAVVWLDREEEAVAGMLSEAFGSRVRRASESVMEVRTDGRTFLPDEDDARLLDLTGDWLTVVVALVQDLKFSPFERRGQRAQREVLERLRMLRIQWAQEITLSVDEVDVELPTHMARAFPATSDAHPYLVVAGERADHLGVEALERIAPSFAEALQIGNLGPDLRVALVELARADDSAHGPSDSALAGAFETTEEYVRQVRADVAGETRVATYLLLPVLAYFIGEGVHEARLKIEAAQRIEVLETALSEYREYLPYPPSELIHICLDAGNLETVRKALGLEFARFNAALTSVGGDYAPFRYPDAHATSMEWFKATHRERLKAAVRQHFLPTFDRGGDLVEYLKLRDLQDLKPDPAWLDSHAEPTEAMLAQRASEWLADAGVSESSPTELPPLDEVSARNRACVEDALRELRKLVIAWCIKRGRQPPGMTADASWPSALVRELGQDGWLDFRELSGEWVIGMLVEREIWPDGMPHSADQATLGLTSEELTQSDETDEQERRRRARESRTISLDGKSFSAEEADLAELAAAVSRTVSATLLSTPREPAALEEMGNPTSRSSTQRGGRNRRRPREPTPLQKSAIGLIGEVAAFEWLKRQFGDIVNAGTWKSSYRDVVFGGATGNDDLGFDFEVVLKSKHIRYEVKATPAADLCEFEMGRSEVRAAQQAASRGRRLEYWILYLRSALDSDARTLHVLPNPFSPEGAAFFRQVGRGLTYRFNLGN